MTSKRSRAPDPVPELNARRRQFLFQLSMRLPVANAWPHVHSALFSNRKTSVDCAEYVQDCGSDFRPD